MSGYVFLYALVVLVLLQYFSNVSAFNGRCASGWTLFEHSCYTIRMSSAQFPAAQVKCESLGGSLVSISSAKENQFVIAMTGPISSFWIGLNDIQQEGVFQWMDGTQFRYSWDNNTDQDHEDYGGSGNSPCTPFSNQGYCRDAELDFSRWSRREPNNAHGGEDCVYMYVYVMPNGYWKDSPCRGRRSYVCEKVASEEGTLAETTITCPHSFETVVELGIAQKTVSWSEPAYLADSLASHIERSHSPGAEFRDGVTWVNYTFRDQYNNMATCNFSITVLEVNNPMESLVNAETFEGQDLVKNKIGGDINKVHGLVAGLYVILGFIGLTLVLLFVVRLIRRKIDTGAGKQSYAKMNGDAEIDVVRI